MKRRIYLLFFFILATVSAAPPANISLLVIDFKYNGADGLKVCEVQPLRVSKIRGYYYSHPEYPSYIKDLLRDWFDSFDMPKWAEGKRLGDYELKKVFYEKFTLICSPLLSLQTDKEIMSHRDVAPSDDQDIHAYTGMMYLSEKSMRKTKDLRIRYPSFLFIDEVFAPLYADKLGVDRVFSSNSDLSNFRPKWKCYEKKYSNSLAREILEDLGSDIVVIKPRHASRGYGVLIVPSSQLDETLKFILTKTSHLKGHKDPSYSYWYRESSEDFIVEEFIPSDPIEMDGKFYDPTYRFLAVLYYDKGKPHVNLLDGYAKLPMKGVEASGSYNERHKSCGAIPYFTTINGEDDPVFRDQLQICFELFYKELTEQAVSGN